VKWTEEAARQLEVSPFVVNSAFCVCSYTFHKLIYAQQYSESWGL